MSIVIIGGRRDVSYRKHWPALVQRSGQICFYCGEFATCIDHIIPVSYGGENDIDNLVLSCSWCNLIASDKVFDTIEEKQDYVMRSRSRRRKVTRVICTDCLMPFQYRVLSPSLFLCAECYDALEGANYAKRKAWRQWIETLYEAGVPVDAHRQLRTIGVRHRERQQISLVQLTYYTNEVGV